AITGRVAQFGRGLMQDVADRLLTQFAQCVASSLTPAPTEAPVAAEPADEAAESVPSARPPSAPARPQPQPQSVGMFGILLSVFWKRIRGMFGSS
ncbi:MAG: hypothetical protein ACYCX9_12425, partial [Candidatus Dormibacteria bacterium]